MGEMMRLQVVVSMRDMMSRGMIAAKRAVDNLEGGMKDLVVSGMKWVKTGAMVAATGAAIMATMAGPVLASAKFAHGMAEVSTMVDTSVVDMKKLGSGVLDVAAKYGQTQRESTKALYNILSAGIKTSKSLNVLALSSKAAVAGVTDVNTAAMLGTNILNAYQMAPGKLSHVYDVLFNTVKQGVTTFPELAAYIGQVTSVGAAAHVPLEQLTGSIAVMTKAGIRSRIAVTGLRTILAALNQPATMAGKEIRKLGGAAVETAIKQGNLLKVLEILKRKGISSFAEITKVFPSVEAASSVAALLNNLEGFRSTVAILKNSGGAAQEAYDKMRKSPAQQWNILKASVAALAVEIGNKLLPAVQGLLSHLIPVVQGMREWMKAHPVLTSVIAKTVAVLGVLLTILGTAAMLVGGFKLAIGLLVPQLATLWGSLVAGTTAVWSFTAALLANPITWVVIAVAALGYGIYKLVKHWQTVKRVFLAVVSVFREYLAKAPDWLLALLGPIGWVLLAFKRWDKIKGIASNAFGWVKKHALSALSTIKNAVHKAPDWLLMMIPVVGQVALAFRHWDKIKKIAVDVFGYIPKLFDKVVAWITNRAVDLVNVILGPINKIREKLHMKPIALGVHVKPEDIAAGRKELADMYKEGLGETARMAKNAWGGVKHAFRDVASAAKAAGGAVHKTAAELKAGAAGGTGIKLDANWRALAARLENFGTGMVADQRLTGRVASPPISPAAAERTVKASWQKSSLTTHNATSSTNSRVVRVGGVTIHVNGAQDPEAVGREVRKQLQLVAEMG